MATTDTSAVNKLDQTPPPVAENMQSKAKPDASDDSQNAALSKAHANNPDPHKDIQPTK